MLGLVLDVSVQTSELGRLAFAVFKRVYLPVGPWRAAGALGLGMTPGVLRDEVIWWARVLQFLVALPRLLLLLF